MNSDTEAESSVVQTSPLSTTDNERHKSCQTLPMSPRSVGVIYFYLLFFIIFYYIMSGALVALNSRR